MSEMFIYLDGSLAEEGQVRLGVGHHRLELVEDDLAGREVVAGLQDRDGQLGRIQERGGQTSNLHITQKTT